MSSAVRERLHPTASPGGRRMTTPFSYYFHLVSTVSLFFCLSPSVSCQCTLTDQISYPLTDDCHRLLTSRALPSMSRLSKLPKSRRPRHVPVRFFFPLSHHRRSGNGLRIARKRWKEPRRTKWIFLSLTALQVHCGPHILRKVSTRHRLKV